jgi:uncharacterized membrane protein YoaK (UPF0700 family)
MDHGNNRLFVLAICLSAVGGYADALGFINLGGFFVSFMSGNSTRLAVALGKGSFFDAEVAAGIIFSFLAGVMLGSAIGERARHRHAAILGCVATLLALAGALDAWGPKFLSVVPLAMAMGAENAVFEKDGEVTMGLTYMTGALVKIATALRTALAGGKRFGWLRPLLLWSGMLAGAVAGTAVYAHVGFQGLWGATGAMVIFAILSVWL